MSLIPTKITNRLSPARHATSSGAGTKWPTKLSTWLRRSPAHESTIEVSVTAEQRAKSKVVLVRLCSAAR